MMSKEEPDFSNPTLKTLEYIIWDYDGDTSIYDLIENWYQAIHEKILKELSPKINPAYEGWNTLESTSKAEVLLRFLGIDKKEAWKKIKEKKLC